MCYYDLYQMACGDYNWGGLREGCPNTQVHHNTCHQKTPTTIIQKAEMCEYCQSIQNKYVRLRKLKYRIRELQNTADREINQAIPRLDMRILQLQIHIVNCAEERFGNIAENMNEAWEPEPDEDRELRIVVEKWKSVFDLESEVSQPEEVTNALRDELNVALEHFLTRHEAFHLSQGTDVRIELNLGGNKWGEEEL